MNISLTGHQTRLTTFEGGVAPAPVARYQSGSSARLSRMVSDSDVGVSDRVMAAIDEAGNAPAEVSVTTAPMDHGVMTDVSIHETDQDDGTRSVHHRSSVSMIPKSDGAGIGPLGRYEESASSAAEVGLLYQGLKINQRV